MDETLQKNLMISLVPVVEFPVNLAVQLESNLVDLQDSPLMLKGDQMMLVVS